MPFQRTGKIEAGNSRWDDASKIRLARRSYRPQEEKLREAEEWPDHSPGGGTFRRCSGREQSPPTNPLPRPLTTQSDVCDVSCLEAGPDPAP